LKKGELRIMNQELRETGIKKIPIKSFDNLEVWKEGHKLVIQIYKATKGFPKEELFGLTNQIRRASVSITSNIAEGFSRGSFKEKVQFYCIALGSLTETQNQLIIARDIGYLLSEDFNKIYSQTILVNKLCNGLIKKSKTFFS
jgi:four helix bundle protein